jgi:immune inhibitor A
MPEPRHRELVELLHRVQDFRDADPTRCAVAPAPELNDRINEAVTSLRDSADALLAPRLRLRLEPQRLGYNDGLIVPPDEFPVGTPALVMRRAAAERAPLRGTVRVVVVLVEFSDRSIGATADHFRDLFFSTGVIPTGSVREYYTEVSNGLVTIDGEVLGPYTLPLTLAQYAHGESGIGNVLPNATTMARDTVLASDPDVDFTPYDNDANGFVDAFVVVHAGSGAEQTGSASDIWSHKWNTQGGAMNVDSTKIFGYLTVPEDALLGVCAHEVGHLLYGWLDYYDTDGSSEGIGNWCLMGSGSWNAGGNTPAHPCAFLKVDQGWITVSNRTTNGTETFVDVKDGFNAVRLWKDGTASSEYFLVENRQRNRFDAQLPGDGLLIWHIDETVANNRDETHYRIALMQADGNKDLEGNVNRGDAGDPFPGSAGNSTFAASSNPNSKSYAGVDTCVAVTGVTAPGPTMTANVRVQCATKLKERPKEQKDLKDRFKEVKEGRKEFKELKEGRKDFKEIKEVAKDVKELKEGAKDVKELKEGAKDLKEVKEGGKDFKEGKEIFERPGGGFGGFGQAPSEGAGDLGALEARVAALEAQLGGTEPFIDESLRPDLSRGAYEAEPDAGATPLAEGGRDEKRQLDSWQP